MTDGTVLDKKAGGSPPAGSAFRVPVLADRVLLRGGENQSVGSPILARCASAKNGQDCARLTETDFKNRQKQWCLWQADDPTAVPPVSSGCVPNLALGSIPQDGQVEWGYAWYPEKRYDAAGTKLVDGVVPFIEIRAAAQRAVGGPSQQGGWSVVRGAQQGGRLGPPPRTTDLGQHQKSPSFDVGDAKRRIRAILDSLIEKSIEHVVLIPFGCGVFNNPPDVVAGLFRQALFSEGRDYIDSVQLDQPQSGVVDGSVQPRIKHFKVVAFAFFSVDQTKKVDNWPEFEQHFYQVGQLFWSR